MSKTRSRADAVKTKVGERNVKGRRRLPRSRPPKFTPEGTYILQVPRGFLAAIRNARNNIGWLSIFLADQLPYRPTGEKIAGMLDLLSWLAQDVADIQASLERKLVKPSCASARHPEG